MTHDETPDFRPKLSYAKAEEIRQRVRDDTTLTFAQLAREYGVSLDSISDVINFVTYARPDNGARKLEHALPSHSERMQKIMAQEVQKAKGELRDHLISSEIAIALNMGRTTVNRWWAVWEQETGIEFPRGQRFGGGMTEAPRLLPPNMLDDFRAFIEKRRAEAEKQRSASRSRTPRPPRESRIRVGVCPERTASPAQEAAQRRQSASVSRFVQARYGTSPDDELSALLDEIQLLVHKVYNLGKKHAGHEMAQKMREIFNEPDELE